jgi:DNA topoisomerase-1
MRTDAVMVAPEAQTAAADFIQQAYCTNYLPAETPQYRSKANAQEAHEAIRPTAVTLTPDQVKETKGDGAALYGLIWRRFVASQMAPAVDQVQTVIVLAGKQQGEPFPLIFEARGSTPQFDGFKRVYQAEADTEQDEVDSSESVLPVLANEQVLALKALHPQPKQTQPPARFTEAQLVQELEKREIGRPSTYAAILGNLKAREYIRLEKKRLIPTDTGAKLNDYLLRGFAPLFAYDYTARMEAELDEIAAGQRAEQDALNNFWAAFQPLLRGAAVEASSLAPKAAPPERQKTGEVCPQCGADLVYRNGSKGQFVGCSAFPKCRYTAQHEHQPLVIHPAQS